MARLEPRLPLLTGGPRNLPARLQTMRDAIAWSYELLNEEERAFLRQLAVFTGGFSLESAKAVAAARIADAAFLDLVASLVDKSLLRHMDAPDSEPRFRMLETIREYALGQLEIIGESDAAHRRHANWFLEVSKQVDLNLEGPDLFLWLLRIEAEHANLRAAIEWLCAQGDTGSALRLGAGLSGFWWYRGHFGEGRAWLTTLLNMPDAREHPYAWARAMTGLGSLMYKSGVDIPRAAELHEQAIVVWRGLGNPERLGYALWCLGLTLGGTNPDRALEALNEAIAIGESLNWIWLIGPCKYTLGRMARAQGDLEKADTLLTETLRFCRQVSHKIGIPLTLAALGNVTLDKGEFLRSATYFGEGLDYLRDIGERWGTAGRLKGMAAVAAAPWGVPTCLEGMAGLAGERGEPLRAARLLGGVASLRETSGFRQEAVERPLFELRLAQIRASADDAAFDMAWAEGRQMTIDAVMEDALALVDQITHETEDGYNSVTPLFRTG